MPQNPDKIADKLGIHAPESQINVGHLYVGSPEAPETPAKKPIDWQQICQRMLADREQLTSNRLMMSPDMHKTLSVFVDLALVQQSKADKKDGDVLPEYGSQLYEPSRYADSERFEFNRFLEEVLKVQKNEKLTIIGEPGCGKTTLLQKIAFWLLENTEDLVIWVSLGELKSKSLRDYLTEDWLQDAMMYADAKTLEDWEQQFLKRRVWLLLDGLDEMTPETRDALSLNGWVSQARVVVTCRLNVWQTNPRLINGFTTFRMLEFRPAQIEEFTHKWFPDQQSSQQLLRALNQPGKERIKNLVRNPLRLTLLCATWHLREGQLPSTRAELYKQFVDDLYEWKGKTFPVSMQKRAELNEQLGVLAQAAIDKEVTRFRLRHDLVCEVLGDPDDSDSLLRLALDLGWLNTVGLDPSNPRKPVYAFFHATLQEYFAAVNIDDWDFFVPRNHVDQPVKNPDGTPKPYRIFEPQWKEVILLWLGRRDINEDRKNKFLNFLDEFNDGCRGFYWYRTFFLLVLGMLEVDRYSALKKVIQKVIRWSFGESDPETQKYFSYFTPIQRQSRITLLGIPRSFTLDELFELINELNNEFVRHEIANTIGQIEFNNSKAAKLLLDLVHCTTNDGLKLKASESLIQNHKGWDSEVNKALVTLAKNCKNEWIRRDAAWALLKLKHNHPDGIKCLMNLFCTSQDDVLLFNLRLDEIISGNPRILRMLLRMSYFGKTSKVRRIAMMYLTDILIIEKGVIEKFAFIIKAIISINSFKKENCDANGIRTLESLRKWADESQCVNDSEKRKFAFFKILEFSLRNPDTAVLIARIGREKSGNETIKKRISCLCEMLDINIESIVSTWIESIKKVKDESFRSSLAVRIVDSGFEDSRVETTLSEALEDIDSKDFSGENHRRQLARTLAKINPKHSLASARLLELINQSEHLYICLWAATDLGEICNENTSIVGQLTHFLSETHEARISNSIATGLQKVFEPEALKVIVNKLSQHCNQETQKRNFILYEKSFEILWHCASRLSYPEFYAAWHDQPSKPETQPT